MCLCYIYIYSCVVVVVFVLFVCVLSLSCLFVVNPNEDAYVLRSFLSGLFFGLENEKYDNSTVCWLPLYECSFLRSRPTRRPRLNLALLRPGLVLGRLLEQPDRLLGQPDTPGTS